METPETQLREIQLALEYCDLDYEEILEDYREHLKNINHKPEPNNNSEHS